MQPDKPLLSVLVPAYNAERYVKQALQSLLKQTYPNFEILACDDGSSDKTISEIESIDDPRIKLFRNVRNQGKNDTANYLLEQAAGEYISVHDADDISLPDRFEKQMNFLLQNPSCVLCGTNFISFLGKGKIIDKSHLESESNKIRDNIKKESQFHGPTIVFKKAIVSEVGGLYRYFDQPSDIDFTMRVAEKFETANLKEYLYLYRHVSSSITNNLNGYDMKRLGDAKMLYYLAEERRSNNGIDSLMKGDPGIIAKLMKEFTREYQADPSIALRKGVFRLLGMRMYGNAIQLAWRTLSLKGSMLNVKCIIYALIHSMSGSIRLMLRQEKIDLHFFEMIGLLRNAYGRILAGLNRLRILLLNGRDGIFIHKTCQIHKGAQIRIWKGGSITIGPDSEIMTGALIFSYGGNIVIGAHCSINPYCMIYGHGGLTIGNNVLIAGGTMIIPNNHIFHDITVPIAFQGNDARGIVIEDDVWIGHGCSILDGVKIGQGSVVAAGSVVKDTIEPYSVIGGVPARLLKMRTKP